MEIETVKKVCDICQTQDASFMCGVCGKDLCFLCGGSIMIRYPKSVRAMSKNPFDELAKAMQNMFCNYDKKIYMCSECFLKFYYVLEQSLLYKIKDKEALK